MRYKIVPKETKIGTVKAVHDGDSIKVQFKDGEVVWIRLYGCDAPEVISNHVTTNQPYGVESGKYLRDLIKGSDVEVETLFKDQYQRMICKVKLINYLDRTLDVDLTWLLITTGNAWWLFEPKQTIGEKALLKGWGDAAKSSKLGFWGHSGRKMRPSTWRKYHKRFTASKLFEDLW